MENNELKHHGIKGMRWGIRRTPKQLGRNTSSKIAEKRVKNEGGKQKVKQLKKKQDELKKKQAEDRKIQSEDAKKTVSNTKKQKQKSVKDMTDAELHAAVNRLQLEQRYKQLNPQQVSKGKKFVNATFDKVVIPAMQEAGKQILKDELTKAGKSVLEKKKK